MAPRLSQYSKSKTKKWKFDPTIEDWTDAAKLCPLDTQMYRYLNVSRETFYAFLDRQRVIVEKGGQSAFIESYENERRKTKKFVALKFLENIKKGDVPSAIFGMKVFNGSIEAKDIYLIELKKKELEHKSKAFLTELAKKFDLNPEQLEKFADAYFKPIEMD